MRKRGCNKFSTTWNRYNGFGAEAADPRLEGVEPPGVCNPSQLHILTPNVNAAIHIKPLIRKNINAAMPPLLASIFHLLSMGLVSGLDLTGC